MYTDMHDIYDTSMQTDVKHTGRHPIRNFSRIYGDGRAVLRVACPVTAFRWATRLVTHLPEVVRSRSLRTADAAWAGPGARFRTPGGRTLRLPGVHTAGAREMYCRNVYLRTGLTIPAGGWVVDLGANAGLFTLLAAVERARVVAVEAQQGFVPEINRMLWLNRVNPDLVQIEVAVAAPAAPELAVVGVVADDARWRGASHAGPDRPARCAVPDLLERHRIDRIGLLKVDIEGSEFSLLHPAAGLDWLARVDQITMEVHPEFGSVADLVELLRRHGFSVTVTGNDGRPVPAAAPVAAYLYAVAGPPG